MTDKPASSPRLWRSLGLGAAALGPAAGPAAAARVELAGLQVR